MKRFLRLSFFIGVFSVSVARLNAQCTVSNIVIQNTSVVSQSGGSCTVRFDVSFNIENNNGNKFIFIHAWLQQDYPNYFQCVDGHTTLNGAIHAPDANDLGNEFLTIGIDNSGASPVLLTEYTPDPSVPITSVAGIQSQVMANGSANIILTGVTTTLPIACGTPVVVIADLWSSQSARAQVAHCVNCGISYSAGYLSVAGFVNCATLMYNATITNNTAASVSGFYRIYADVNSDGYFTPASDTLLQDTTYFSIAAGPGTTTLASGPVPIANRNQDLFIVITQTSGQASGASRVVLLQSTECIPLPVTFRAFTATRINRSNVALRWETASESNNLGFSIQRNLGGNNWETVAFINSQAQNGNSNSLLAYAYTDLNTHSGISQYRIMQVDLDYKARLSEIRAVRGDGQKEKTIVYPNPSRDGSINVVFDKQDGVRDVYLSDPTGRIIKKWDGLTENILEIKNLAGGLYILRIVVRETGNQSVEKVLVSTH